MTSTSAEKAVGTMGILRVPLLRDPLAEISEVCAICLGPPQGLSCANTCFHQFCFFCIMEWSKVKWSCPVCKQAFSSVITNVKSVTDYEEFALKPIETQDYGSRRIPLPPARRALILRIRRLNAMLQAANPILVNRVRLMCSRLDNNDVSTEDLQADLQRLISSTNYRRFLYDRKIRVVPPVNESRYRDCSPQFLKEYPAVCHRLAPWIQRELLCIYGSDDDDKIVFLVELIISNIKEMNMTSDRFQRTLWPYLCDFTDQFIHEFYNFARSPYDIDEYDLKANYDQIPVEENVEVDDGLVVVSASVTRSNGWRQQLADLYDMFSHHNYAANPLRPTQPTASHWSSDEETPPPSAPLAKCPVEQRAAEPARMSREWVVRRHLQSLVASRRRMMGAANRAQNNAIAPAVAEAAIEVEPTPDQSGVDTIYLSSDSEIDEPFYGFSRICSSNESAEAVCASDSQPSTSKGVGISDPLVKYRLDRNKIHQQLMERRQRLDRIYSDLSSDEESTIPPPKSDMDDLAEVEVLAEMKPKHLRTPELVEINSDEETQSAGVDHVESPKKRHRRHEGRTKGKKCRRERSRSAQAQNPDERKPLPVPTVTPRLKSVVVVVNRDSSRSRSEDVQVCQR